MPVMDFSKPVPASDGIHTVQCVAATPGQSAAGNLKIEMRWKILASHDPINVGKVIFDRLVFSEGSWFRVVNCVNACGLDTANWQGKEIDETAVITIAKMLIGETINVETQIKPGFGINPLTDEVYDDKAEIRKYLPYARLDKNAALFAPAEVGEDKLPF